MCPAWLIVLCAVACAALSGRAASDQKPASPSRAELPHLSIASASNIARTLPLYNAALNYTFHLPKPMRKNGVVYTGANGRLRKVLTKLYNREPTKVGVIGGSITCGHGVQRGTYDWFSWVVRYLVTAFKDTRITARNGCVPATQSEYVSMCLSKFVDDDVDLVFIEYAANDGYVDGSISNTRTQAYERLLRKLMQLPNRPAVVLMEFLSTNVKQNNLPFYWTIEDQYGVLSQYYSLPWLSVRDAVWHGLANDWEGLKLSDIFIPGDQRHPNERGHKYMADLVVEMMQQTALDLAINPLINAELSAYKFTIPPPMFKFNQEGQNLICATGIDFKAAITDHEDWYFINEGTPAKPKWGYVTYTPGATLIIELDTRSQGGRPLRQLPQQEREILEQQQGLLSAASSQLEASTSAGGVLGPEPEDPAEVAAQRADWATKGEAPWTTVQYDAGVELDPGLLAAQKAVEAQAKHWGAQLASGHLNKYLSRGERLVGGATNKQEVPDDLYRPAQHHFLSGVTVVLPPSQIESNDSSSSSSANGSSSVSSSGSGSGRSGSMDGGLGQGTGAAVPGPAAAGGKQARVPIPVTSAPGGRRQLQQSGGSSRQDRTRREHDAGGWPPGSLGWLRLGSLRKVLNQQQGQGQDQPLELVEGKGQHQISKEQGTQQQQKQKQQQQQQQQLREQEQQQQQQQQQLREQEQQQDVQRLQQQTRQVLQDPAAPSPDQQGTGGVFAGVGPGGGALDMLVWVGYLKSYRQMGSARLTCLSGCACAQLMVDGFHTEKTSQTFLARLRVSQHERCRIAVQVLPHYTASGHFKFKVTSAMLTKYVEYSQEGDFTDQVLMTAIEDSQKS